MKKFENYARVLPWFMALALSVLLAACGGGRDPILGSGQVGGVAPTVTAVNPLNNAIGVPTNTKVGATFTQAMDPLSITKTTFTLKQGATVVDGSTSYSGVNAVFTPTSTLASNTAYTATITTGAKDLAGNGLANDYVWSWTTGAAADTTAPMITATINANGATGVATNTKVGATFSEGMDPLSITATSFTLKQGATAVTGTTSYSGVNAVFTPTSLLANSTTYTATITTGAKDLAGNAMANDYVWSWTTGAAADTIAPTVTLVNPVALATNVATNTKVGATFSEGMDPLTVTTTTFTLKQGATTVAGTTSYSGVNAVFTPTSALANSTTYTATVTTGAKDLAGNAMANDYVWNWTTGTAADMIAPTVTLVNPADLATNVATNSAVAATFSEAMDPLTVSTATFTVAGITGTVGFDAVAKMATFTPSAPLATNTTYTATIKAGINGVKDVAENAMVLDKVWSFTTLAAAPKGPAVVNLRSAANFVVLSKSAISTTGTTAIVGDIGVSPSAASFITGFGLIADSTNTFSTSSVVTGKVYAADYAVPTPTTMTTAISDMETAFTDAAGRAIPTATELGAGNISGMTLAPGLYKWGTGVVVTSAGVTLSGGPDDVWIFQIGQDLTVNNSAMITLSGGAQAKNIFWQVAGQATLGTAADFKGNILSQTLISLSTGAVVTGRLLAQTAVTLDAARVTKP